MLVREICYTGNYRVWEVRIIRSFKLHYLPYNFISKYVIITITASVFVKSFKTEFPVILKSYQWQRKPFIDDISCLDNENFWKLNYT